MDYSKLSNYEINVLVARTQGYHYENGWSVHRIDLDYDRVIVHEGYGDCHRLDYCSDPRDAWPLVLEESISVKIYPVAAVLAIATCGEFDGIDFKYEATHSNPLRAMIECYLQTKEDVNGEIH